MKFEYVSNSSIPRGAWCAIISRGCDVVRVITGKSVCKTENWFVFGVWDGDFSSGRFDKAQFACCTGASVKNCKWGGVKFTTPFHLLETIYGIVNNDAFYLSNSLPFVLKMANAVLDCNYANYQYDLSSSLFGTQRQIFSSPLNNGLSLQYFRGCNFEVDKELNVKIDRHQSNIEFKNFNSYFKTVVDILTGIKNNAQSSDREKPYDMISTISRGYDAVASSALASIIGCNRAFTFNQPASYRSDDGQDIARVLGYNDIIIGNAYLYKEETEKPLEAANIASGDFGSDLLSPYSRHFKDSLLFMGTRGDSMWERNHSNVNDFQDFTQGNTFQQASLSNVELEVENNTIIIPIPLIGADRWSQVASISQSPELRKWSIRDNYDRPIARRIAEDMGVKRCDFGQIKQGMGVSYHFDTYSRMRSKMSPASANSLHAFRKDYPQKSILLLKWQLRFLFNEIPVYLNYLLNKAKIPIKIKHKEHFVSSPYATLLLNWGISERQKHY